MKAVYIGSFDPAHLGHKNTYEKALLKLNCPIDIAICKSPLKDSGIFSMAERKIIAEDIFKAVRVSLYESETQILNLLNSYDLFVRGYNDESDIVYTKKLLKKYNCENKFSCVSFIKIDDEYKNVSSSNIKNSFLYDSEFSKKYLSIMGYNMLAEKYRK